MVAKGFTSPFSITTIAPPRSATKRRSGLAGAEVTKTGLSKLPSCSVVRARALSAATMANIRQNLFFAFVYNATGVPVAAGVLYPLVGVLLSPVIAAAAMALSSVSVGTNALRLRRGVP